MHARWLLIPALLLAAAAPAAAQGTPDSARARPATDSLRLPARADSSLLPARADSSRLRAPADSPVARPDSVLRAPPADSLPAADSVTAAAPDTVFLGLESLAHLFAVRLSPPFWTDMLRFRPRFEDWSGGWARHARAQLTSGLEELWRTVGLDSAALAAAADTGKGGPGRPPGGPTISPPAGVAGVPGAPAPRQLVLPPSLSQYADVGMIITGRGEMGGAWNRYHPCDPGLRLDCNPSLFPQLKPDLQFGLRVGGTISDRIHLDVDYDQRREFDAANNINVYYQGLPDEILQRLEVGDVSIQLPQSRYLTQGIPAGNFGFKATGQMGPMDFQAVWAQQRGDVSRREFRLNGNQGSAGLVQDQSIVLDDASYVKGQFFFLLDPDSLAGAPHVNILQLRLEDAPASLRPAGGSAIQVYRDERPSAANQQQQAQLGYFLADATTPDGSLKHSGQFRRLVQGEDYIVHSSGLWIVLRQPLRDDEALAVSYVTAAGDTVGALDAENSPAGVTPTLRLLRGPTTIHQPGAATWKYEMHQVYRLDSSSGVDPSSVNLTISLGELSGGKTFAQVGADQVTYLRLFGLDENAPADQIDNAQIYQPAADNGFGGGAAGGGGGGAPTVGGTFIVFPTLQPFEAPPPVPAAGLDSAQSRAALGTDANSDIYENPDPVTRESSSRFRLSFDYRVKVDGLVSTFSLGALGIREGSEKITIGGKPLARGTDYTIDYDIGQVTLTNPESLFGTTPDAQIQATWEQKSQFQIAPTSVFGLNTKYALGKRGELDFMGLYQAQRSINARPQLGNEPGSIMLGGVSGRMDLGGRLLDRALARLPGLRLNGASSVKLTGELALSSPNPNRQGATYVDDFESTDQISLSLDRPVWRLGSRPADLTGAGAVLPPVLDAASAMRLVWQHDYRTSDGVIAGLLDPTTQIDDSIKVVGTSGAGGEPVLYMTYGDSAMTPGARRWRSLTTVLSTTGRDLSRSEYLEFYVAHTVGQDAALILDLGTVGEDAFYYDAQGQVTGTYPDGTPWGQGTLDQEVNVARHEVWSAVSDSLGLWNQDCHAAPGQTYPLGDPRADCTRGNGMLDSEDLDGNGVPDLSDGAYFRYVVPLDRMTPYLVRDTSITGTHFQLYRIPLRGMDAIPIGGATEGTWRFIKDLRITVAATVGERPGQVLLARMNIIGSRWAKRGVSGIVDGLDRTDPGAPGDAAGFRVGPVSRVNDSGYASPPGVTDQLQDPTSALGVSSVEINEKALRLSVTALQPDSRAEVYYRYPQQPRNFLSYRQMRVWAVARQGNWGPSGDEQLLIKVGNDDANYYLYRTRLAAPVPGAGAKASDWLPEIAIDFEPWFELRAAAEEALIQQPDRTAPLVLWSADSTYGVVLQDRARAPNLAAVRELSFSIYNGGIAPEPAEVWIDDVRLGSALTDPGFAGAVNLDVRGGDFIAATASYSHQGALFHQLGQGASYQRSADMGLNARAELGHLAPTGWGIEAPLTVSYAHTGLDPMFLQQSDVLANQLSNLRFTGASRTRVDLALRRTTPASNPWLGLLLDGTALRLGYSAASNGNITSLSQAGGLDAALTYDRKIDAHELDITPGFVDGLVHALFPAFLEKSQLFKELTGAKLRWSPDAISFSTSYSNQQSRAYRYSTILALPSDTLVAPVESPRMGLQNTARLSLRPFETMSASVSVNSTRDLLPADRATTAPLQRQAIRDARGSVGGLDIGWETARNMTTSFAFRPRVASWLQPGLSYSAHFGTARNPSYLRIIADGADSSAALQRQFQADRTLNRTLQIDPGGLMSTLFGARRDSTAGRASRVLRSIGSAVRPIDLTWIDGLGSQFERADGDPGTGYQLGLGGLGGFRVIGQDTAVSTNQRSAFRARTGLALPFQTQLALSYDGSDNSYLDTRGGQRTQHQATWPDIQLQWGSIPIPGFARPVFRHLSMTTGYQHTDQRNVLGGAGLVLEGGAGGPGGGGAGATRAQVRSTVQSRYPLQLSLGVGTIGTATYTGSITHGSTADPTGNAQEDQTNHTVQLSGAFRAPPMFRDKLKSPLHVSLSLSQQGERSCRFVQTTTESSGCVPYVDYMNRRIDLTFDTMLSDLNVGVQMSYNSRQSHIGTLNGTSQFQLGIFGQFDLSAGQLPSDLPH